VLAVDRVPERHDAAAVPAVACRPVHAVLRPAVKDTRLVLPERGEDVEHERAQSALDHADDSHPEFLELLSYGCHVRQASTESIEAIDPELGEETCLSVAEETSAGGPVRQRDLQAGEPIIDVAADDRDPGLARKPAVQLLLLGLYGLALPLVF
jgi:hypothetical protein